MKTLTSKRATLAILVLTAASLVAGCSERIYMPKVRELLESARSGAFRKAYACTSEGFRSKVPVDRFQSQLEQVLDIRNATVRELKFGGQTSTRAGVVRGALETRKGVVPVTFALYRSVTGMDYLVDDIEVRGASLFGIGSD